MKTKTPARRTTGTRAPRPTARRGVLLVVSIAVVAVAITAGVGGSRGFGPAETAQWPDRVAVVGLDPANRRQPVAFLGVVDPERRTVVSIPPDAVVEVPDSGFLRAYHAYRLGEARLVRSTLEGLFGVSIPFSATGHGDSLERVASHLVEMEVMPRRADELRALLDDIRGGGWQLVEVTGERQPGARGLEVVPDPDSLRQAAAALGGVATAAALSDRQRTLGEMLPEAPPPQAVEEQEAPSDIPPADIRVEVLNGGEVAFAARDTAARLRDQGYDVVRSGNFQPGNREASVVYFSEGADDKARQLGAALGYPVEPLPDGISTRADVLVLLGDDAQT